MSSIYVRVYNFCPNKTNNAGQLAQSYSTNTSFFFQISKKKRFREQLVGPHRWMVGYVHHNGLHLKLRSHDLEICVAGVSLDVFPSKESV